MLTWIKFYNTAVHLHRLPGTTELYRTPTTITTTTITFRDIYNLTSTLTSSKRQLTIEGVDVSTKFAQSASRLLKRTAEDKEQEVDIVFKENDANDLGEAEDDGNDDEAEREIDDDETTYDLMEVEKVRVELVQLLASEIPNGTFVQVDYKAKSRSNIIQAIYEEVATITLNSKAISEEIEFVKLAVSN